MHIRVCIIYIYIRHICIHHGIMSIIRIIINGKNTIVIIILIIHNNNIINYVYKVFPIEVSLQLWRSRFADLLEQADLEIFWDFMGL